MSSPAPGAVEPRPVRRATRPILGWTLAGAAVPAGLLVVPSVPVVLASLGTENLSLATTLGMIVLTLVMVVPPGAVGGFVVGLVDLVLRRYVARGAPRSRRARARVAALGLFVLLTALGLVFLLVTASDLAGIASNTVFCGLVAAVPAIVAYRLYRRLPVDADLAPRREALRAP